MTPLNQDEFDDLLDRIEYRYSMRYFITHQAPLMLLGALCGFVFVYVVLHYVS